MRSATLPVARHEVIPAVPLIPTLWYPMRAMALVDPAAVYPDVLMAVPAVIAGSPDESGTRRRCLDHTRRGRRNVDIDTDSRNGGRHRADQHCSRERRGGETQFKGSHSSQPPSERGP